MATQRRWSYPGLVARYTMREASQSGEGAFVVENERGDWIFRVEADTSGSTRALVFSDRLGRQLCSLDLEAPHPMNAISIERGGHPYAVMRLPVSSTQGRAALEMPGGDLELRGNVRICEYVFQRRGHAVAKVSKNWMLPADTYTVDIVAGQEDAIILAATIAVDFLVRDLAAKSADAEG